MFDIVIVLYQMTIEQSKTVQSLKQLLDQSAIDGLQTIYVIDNSPQKNQVTLEAPFQYYGNGENLGLAKAYNFVWPKSLAAGRKWLVTFDQDSEVTKEYLNTLIAAFKTTPEKTALIAPIVFDQAQQISPVAANTLRPLQSVLPKAGIYEAEIMVINSGTAVNLGFLSIISGYNEAFPLDYLDHWLSWQVFNQHWQIEVLSTTIQHELSVLSDQTLSLTRYESILVAENLFYRRYQTKLKVQYKRQLVLRGIKQVVKGRLRFARQTFRQLENVGGTHGS